MSVLLNDPLILWSVIGGVAFLLALKVAAFLTVRHMMKSSSSSPDGLDDSAGDTGSVGANEMAGDMSFDGGE